jgi:hypothetical protein
MSDLTPLVPLVAACMLAAALPRPGWALPPPRPPPCVPASPAVTIAALAAVAKGDGPDHLRHCAVNDLAERGAAAVPIALGMLDSEDLATLSLGLELVTTLGARGQAALPALMAMIEKPPAVLYPNESTLYDAVGAIGAAARPAIPLLIARSREGLVRYAAIRTLGTLGQYDAGRVVPHLVALLTNLKGERSAIEAPDLLRALAAIGKDARGALPATLASLERAKADGASMHGAAALQALVAIAEPGESVPILVGLIDHPMLAMEAVGGLATIGKPAASAVPALIDKLGRSRAERYMPDRIVATLVEIAPGSRAVQQQLLEEATRHGSDNAAYALAQIDPLPADFAPALAAALADKPGDTFLGMALRNARRAR